MKQLSMHLYRNNLTKRARKIKNKINTKIKLTKFKMDTYESINYQR
jgi:hypothetical protein